MNEFYSLGFLLNRAAITMAKSLNDGFEVHGMDLSLSQYVVLRCLYSKYALSQLEIANMLSKDAAAIKRTIDLLEKKGLVTRTPVRTLKNSVSITEKGEKLMPQILKIADERIEKALNGIEPHDRKLLQVMLDKIYVNLNNKE